MIRAFQWDLARQVERLDWLQRQLPHYAEWGYQELYLHLEDAVDYPGLPGIARADAYSWSEFEQLVRTAQRHGIGVVPIVNLLGHTQYLIKSPEWRDLNELRAADGSALPTGQICPVHPRTAEVAERLFQDVAPLCTAGKVHVGLDESFLLGRHPLSQAEIATVGLAGHFARYVHRLHALARHHHLRLGLWADMLAFLPEAIPQLPADIIAYDWYYHGFSRHPRVELFNFAECDLATPLQAHGIEYWGCPMNGAFRFEPLPVFGDRLANAQSWWRRCRQLQAGGFLVTSWEAYRLAIELTTVVDAAIASLWLEPDLEDHPAMLARGYTRALHAREPKRAARVSLATDASAFAGYARWETNARWDVISTHDGLAAAGREARQLARLTAQAALPDPLRHSLAFRHYLAERDGFVRRAAKAVFALRRLRPSGSTGLSAVQAARWTAQLDALEQAVQTFRGRLRAGRQAARAMWRRTRPPGRKGQNEQILDADAARLRAWHQWVRNCRRRPSAVWSASPVAGAWQLQFDVITTAPAMQRVVVEQRQPDGGWHEVRGRHTIEFRSFAARPRATLRRPFVAAVSDPAAPLRVAVRGVGDVLIALPELTNGVQVLRPVNWTRAERRRLGHPAPSHGWPKWDPAVNNAALALTFPPADTTGAEATGSSRQSLQLGA